MNKENAININTLIFVISTIAFIFIQTINFMSRFEQSSSCFKKNEIIQFFENYNALCDDYKIMNIFKCIRFFNYCVEEIKDLVKILKKYLKKD